jgi:uncharacterized protein YraI
VSAQYVQVSNAVSIPADTPAQALGGRVAVMAAELNVRAAGSVDAAKIGVAAQGSAYAIIGEADGWYQIDFSGQPGWVSGRYVTVENR